jgi:toxin ParE1/3/4
MRIRWTEPAARDLTNICDYTEEHDGPDSRPPRRAPNLRGHSALSRSFHAVAGPGRKPGTRELVFPGLPFLAVYRVGEEVVEIDRILHGAQKWP